ncbi:MAG TPA: diguanylate cyclase [Chloroflexota bacterium]|nr:diguanylate cyclase [Chloroflexota bacterium]
MDENQSRHPHRILVVEDDPSVASLLRDLFGNDGYVVRTAGSLAMAREILRDVDLTVLDVMLPDGSGLDLCREIRLTSSLARHPILLLSAHGQAPDRIAGLEAGADDFLPKPFDNDELLARVRTLLHTRLIETALRQHTRRLNALRHLTTILVNTVDVSDLAQRVVNAVPAVFGSDAAFLAGLLSTVDPVAKTIQGNAVTDTPLVHAVLSFLERPLREYECSYDPSVNLLHQVALHGTPREANQLADFISPPFLRATADEAEQILSMRGGVAMPVHVQGRLIGVFLFALAKPVTQINPLEREQMRDFVDTIGIALENVRLYAEAARLMVTDSLTGVANRRRFDQALAEEFTRASRLDYPVGLLLIDIDHFKVVNDQFGHQTGDRVIREISHTLNHVVRNTDIVARYGGEEFAVILPGAPEENLAAIGEKIRQAVHDWRESNTIAPGIQITVSVGGAAATPSGTSVDALINAADAALYQAKTAGRDCVRIVGIRDSTEHP